MDKGSDDSKSSGEKTELKVIRHRQNEKVRHQNMTSALDALQDHVPGRPPRETQISSLQRVARYMCLLKTVLRQGHNADLSQLPDLYASCEEMIGRLNSMYDNEPGSGPEDEADA